MSVLNGPATLHRPGPWPNLYERSDVPQSTADRFWSKVRKTDECWEWTAKRTAPGWHGIIKWDGRQQVAHRVSWQLHYGPIPDGLLVCHACDNPGCVRPDHLWLGTQRANMIDAARKGRLYCQRVQVTHCKYGHLFTPENTLRTVDGRRRCRICHNAWHRTYVRAWRLYRRERT